MLSSKCAIIYSFFLLIIIINLIIEANSNSPESKAHSPLVYRTTNQDNTMSHSYKTFSYTNLNKISNTSNNFFNHIESTVNQTDPETEMTLLKRIRRRVSMKSKAGSHRKSHQGAHKLVDRCARKKTSRRDPKLHAQDSNRKNDTSKEQSHMKWKKQGEKSSVFLNSKKVKNVTNTAPIKDYLKNPESFTNNSYITKKRIEKVHGVNKTNLHNLSRNYKTNNKFDVEGKSSHPSAVRMFSSVKGGKHSLVKEIAPIKSSHESSMNQIFSKNKQRTNIHSSVKRINNIQKQKKDKEHKSFKSAAKKLDTSMGETEYALKNDDSLKLNNNRDENTGKITDEERYTSKSHDLLKLKKNGIEDKKNLSESEKLEKASIPFHDQYSKDVKDKLVKTHKKSKEDDGNETTIENSLKIGKVKRKAGHLRNNPASLQQVNVHDALSRIRKHSHPKSLKRNTREEKNILYEVKDFIMNHFPKKRDEQVEKSSQVHKNIRRETRNTNDDNTSRMSRNNDPGFKVKNENSKILEEIKDFVVKNFHIGRKKRNPLVQRNLIPLARSVRSSEDYENHLSHSAIRSTNNVPEKIQSNSFVNTIEESGSFWGDLEGIVKRETETNSISEAVGNLTVSEYDDEDDTNITEVFTDVHPQIIKKGAYANNSTFGTTRQSEEENYKSDSDLVLDQYNENSPELTTNEESITENEGTATDFSLTEVTSEVSATERNLESNTDAKNGSKDQGNVSESPDSSSLPNDGEIPEVTSKHLIEREIATVTNSLSVSSEEAQSSLSSTFSEMSDITTFTSSPVTSTFSNSDSTTYRSTTPLFTELSSTESKDIISVDSSTEWNSESSLSSSMYTEGLENSVETFSVLLSTYSTSEESSSITSTDRIQIGLESRAPKVYRDVQHVKEIEDDYEDKTLSDGSTSDTFEEQEDTNTVGWSNRIQNISTLEGQGNKINNKNKEYEYKLFTITETTPESMNKLDNIKISSNYISKHGGKSQMKQHNYDPERLASNMNKNAQKSRLKSVKDQKEESLSNAESGNEYDEETVSEDARLVLKSTTESGKGEYMRFRNMKKEHTNLKAHQKKKSHSLGNEPQKIVHSHIHSQHSYDGEDVSKSTIQDLILNTERSKGFANAKNKRVNSNIILKGNYQSLGIEFHTLANLGPTTFDNTKEESSTTKSRIHTSGSPKLTVQDKKENNLSKINSYSDEDEYEFQTDSSLQISTATFVSDKVYRKPKEGKTNLKSTQELDESMDKTLDYPPKLIVLHFRNKTVKAEDIPSSLKVVSKDSWTSLPEKEIKSTMLNNQTVNDDEYEDAVSHISTTEILETTPKARIPKEYENRVNKDENLSNHGFEVNSKSNKLQMTTLSGTQPFDDEMLPQTDKPLTEVAGNMKEKESDKSVNKAISSQKLEENWIGKPTKSPKKKLKPSLKYAGLTLNLKKQGDDELEEIESTRKEVEQDQTFATYFVTLQNAKIMPDETTTSSTQSTYSENPRAHESLSRLESINDLGEEYYDEVARNSQSGERVSKHASSDKEMKSLGDKTHVKNEAVSEKKFDYDKDGMNDVERSSYAHETIGYSTATGGLESSTSEEITMNDYELGISETESITETPEHLQKNSVAKISGKDKEFVKHLSSLITHLKQRRRNNQLESMNHRISRRARAVVTSKPTPKPELKQSRMPPAKEWWIGGAGIIIMGLLIIGMYHTVIKVSKKKKVWEKPTKENDFHAVLNRYETDDEMEDRLSDDVRLLQSFIDQLMQKHEISEDGSMKEEYSTAEHLSRIHAAITGTID